MTVFVKLVGAALVCIILYMVLQPHQKSFALVLSLCMCSMILLAAVSYWKPVLEFWKRLENLGKVNQEYVKILMKILGIGILSEMTGTICSDAGNTSLGKAIQYLSVTLILWLSLPMMEELVQLLNNILGQI